MVIIKFGGRSLGTPGGLEQSAQIVKESFEKGEKPVVVLSARGKTTDRLIELTELALEGKGYSAKVGELFSAQPADAPVDFSEESSELLHLLEGINLLGVCPPQVLDRVLSFGERVSVKVFADFLRRRGLNARAVDSGDFFVTDETFGDADILPESEGRTKAYFSGLSDEVIPVVTGFIAKTGRGERTTLGRNGSNYSATLLASYLDAERVDNFTHVDGIYTANPDLVLQARKIKALTYSEAAELAQYGADILHHRTVDPLVKKGIPLRILNTFSPDGLGQQGTVISSTHGEEQVKALATIKGRALIFFEGQEMKDRPGLDARIFGAMSRAGVSVSLISQGSSERGTGLVVAEADAERAVRAFDEEFERDIEAGLIKPAVAVKGLAIVALIGVPLAQFDRPYGALARHGIVPRLLNNTVPTNTLCLLISETEVPLALGVMHSELFDRARKIHLAVIGHGNVGGALIDQVVRQREEILRRKKLSLEIFAVAGSRKVFFPTETLPEDWRERFENGSETRDAVSDIINYARAHHLENLVLVDNTSSLEVAARYPELVEAGFDLVSSNKVGNVQSFASYARLRELLEKNRKSYRYETNVGAGLPIIDFLKLLHLSGDKVTAIRGLFSGSLGYIFGALSRGEKFASVLHKAVAEGFTEPDPRTDLSGIDVARKLIILARELDLPAELGDVAVQSLVPEAYASGSVSDLFDHIDEVERHIERLFSPREGFVGRYVGSLTMPRDGHPAELFCRIESLPEDSVFGQTTAQDGCFEIFTENYGTNPIVIRGAGAGAEVTAQGVFSDILRTAERHNSVG